MFKFKDKTLIFLLIQLKKDSTFINKVIKSSVIKKKNFLTINLNYKNEIFTYNDQN